jgi:colanic acid biosynthesis protein WcaH
MTMKSKLAAAIQILDDAVPDPSAGLPNEVFFYISKTTPLINVDLLIKDELGRTLLAWRNDRYAGTGWHLPGGIIRVKETFAERIRKVSLAEIGIAVEFDPNILAVHEMIHHDQDARNHCISLLYNCRVDSSFVPRNEGVSAAEAGFVQWHERCPDNMIASHHVYRKYI